LNPDIKAATEDRSRITIEGQLLGSKLLNLAESKIPQLIAEDEPDERCTTCAFRKDTVPNGCIQTVMDALKAVSEGKPFMCHSKHDFICHGYYAARLAVGNKIVKTPWEYSKD
jgi:hypothetical protein